MSDYKIAAQLLAKSQQELQALHEMRDNANIVDEIFGFMAQQAVEKALKAWMAAKNIPYALTHDLSILLADLKNNGENIEGFWDLIDLNPYAVQFRYETLSLEEPPIDRQKLINQVKEIIKIVKTIIDHS
ncbi:MAG: hypothetical protein A2W19_06385 [Spirochaetes bacterium RBG_16_49_21]|nr:MAG: hypothetical protein A2W19_06385 [Spirochaetes bacterium RBG_16_49_21]